MYQNIPWNEMPLHGQILAGITSVLLIGIMVMLLYYLTPIGKIFKRNKKMNLPKD